MSSNLSRNPSIKPVSNVNIDRNTMYQCVKKLIKRELVWITEDIYTNIKDLGNPIISLMSFGQSSP